MNLSDIQTKILAKFITSESLRYTQAQPSGVSNDLFKYHLKFLITKGYLIKDGELYNLTEKGKLFGHNIDIHGTIQNDFKIAVACILIVNENGVKKILLQKRSKHPNYGEISYVCGKINRGEHVIDCAKRKFQEETGLLCDFKFIGILRTIRNSPNNKLLNDQWFNYCISEEYSGELNPDLGYGKNFFEDIENLHKLSVNLSIKNLITALEKYRNGDIPFFIEDEETIKDL